MVSVVARILFFGRTDTDNMWENNDHLYGRGLVGQYRVILFSNVFYVRLAEWIIDDSGLVLHFFHQENI